MADYMSLLSPIPQDNSFENLQDSERFVEFLTDHFTDFLSDPSSLIPSTPVQTAATQDNSADETSRDPQNQISESQAADCKHEAEESSAAVDILQLAANVLELDSEVDLTDTSIDLLQSNLAQSDSLPELNISPEDFEEAARLLEEAQNLDDDSAIPQSPAAGVQEDTESGIFSGASDTENSPVAAARNRTVEEPSHDSSSSSSKEDTSTPEKVEDTTGGKAKKPEESYMELIAQAIMANVEGRALLADIYQYALDTNPYFAHSKCAWRNSIRHNLSVNECFVKTGRARNGRGYYWAIHPSCVDAFKRGEFSRRLARAAVQKSQRQHQQQQENHRLPTTAPAQVSCYSPNVVQSRHMYMSSTPVQGHHHHYHPYRRPTTTLQHPTSTTSPSGEYGTNYTAYSYQHNMYNMQMNGQNVYANNMYANQMQMSSPYSQSSYNMHPSPQTGPMYSMAYHM